MNTMEYPYFDAAYSNFLVLVSEITPFQIYTKILSSDDHISPFNWFVHSKEHNSELPASMGPGNKDKFQFSMW